MVEVIWNSKKNSGRPRSLINSQSITSNLRCDNIGHIIVNIIFSRTIIPQARRRCKRCKLHYLSMHEM